MTKKIYTIDCTDDNQWSYVGITDVNWYLCKIEYIDSILKTDGECLVTLPKTISLNNIKWFKIGISKEIDKFTDIYKIEYFESHNYFKITTKK